MAVEGLPLTTTIYGRILDAPSEGWDEKEFGPFPTGGVLLLYMKIPSSNHSKKDKYESNSFLSKYLIDF